MKPKIVFISDVNPDVADFIQFLHSREFECEENNRLGERGLLYHAGSHADVLILTTLPVPAEFIAYVQELFPLTHFSVCTPAGISKTSSDLSAVILQDESVLGEIYAFVGDAPEVLLDCYSVGENFYRLYEKLQVKTNVSLLTTEKNKSQIINKVGTKSGLRRLWEQGQLESGIRMCPGIVIPKQTTNNIEVAVEEATKRYLKNPGVVIKTEKGHAGQGVLIYAPNTLNGPENEIARTIHTALTDEPYWRQFDIIVEDYTKTDPYEIGNGGGFPNAEFRIYENKIEFLYSCGMRIKEGVFQGVEIGNDVLRPSIVEQLKKIGMAVGQILLDGGYVGHFEVDTLAGIDGTVYLSESNVRYTGGSHVFHGGVELLGDEFKNKYIVATNIYQHRCLQAQGMNFHKLRTILRPLEYMQAKKEGLIIVSQALLPQGKFGYMVIADSKDKTDAYEYDMTLLLDSYVEK